VAQTDEERKAKAKANRKKPENRVKKKASSKKYGSSPKGKAKMRAYSQRPENIAKEKTRRNRPDVKANRDKIRYEARLKILKAYSKRLSNSNIPCCRCCGLNDHLEFLALDHIAGKKQMDSEPELVQLGYSSKLGGTSLTKWIISNNFPKGFQILCHNCNMAKGITQNNNECPMKNKPH